MKLLLSFSLFLLLSIGDITCLNAQEADKIKQVIQRSYVEGLMNEGDSAKIDEGFHPDFVMTGLNEKNELWKHPISKWRDQKISMRAEGKLPRSKSEIVTVKFHYVDVSDNTASVKLDYMEGGLITYVDYISLFKINDEWKIIGKIFDKVDKE
jgi:hypothetical protein